MPKINLSEIQTAANTKFSDFEVTLPGGEVATFNPVLRLPKAKRIELGNAMDVKAIAESEDHVDVYDLYQDAFKITAKSKGAFEKLHAAIGDDPAVWQELFKAFSEETQVGEA
jgi:hypothetical protein